MEYNLIQYLQRRNPSVPGIVDKLAPPKERNLEKVKKILEDDRCHKTCLRNLWKGALNEKNISIDHFVPWSYVAHDELWNLTPTTRRINSSKKQQPAGLEYLLSNVM